MTPHLRESQRSCLVCPPLPGSSLASPCSSFLLSPGDHVTQGLCTCCASAWTALPRLIHLAHSCSSFKFFIQMSLSQQGLPQPPSLKLTTPASSNTPQPHLCFIFLQNTHHHKLSLFLKNVIYLDASSPSWGTEVLCYIMPDLSLQCCSTQAWLPHGMWNPCSLIRDQTCVPCIARQILNHWTTREVPDSHCCTVDTNTIL